MSLSGKKNRELQGRTQVRDIRRESIVDYEVTAVKLNPDVAGNGIILDPVTNAINFAAYTIVNTNDELSNAIASGNATIFLTNGEYSINEIAVRSGTLQLIGESKEGVIIELPPSGTITTNHVSGLILTGTATINISNPGVVTISGGNVSGNAPQFSWQNSQIVFDNIAYEVNRVVSGDVSGIAQIELIDPWTQVSGFVGKPFKMMYMIEDLVLRNLTVKSASDSGIINLNRVKKTDIDNVIIAGANPITRNTSGLKMYEAYDCMVRNIDVTGTKATNIYIDDRYCIDLTNVFYSDFDDMSLYNAKSRGIYVSNSDNVRITGSNFVNVNGTSIVITNSNVFVDSNIISTSQNGIYVSSGSVVTIQDNLIENVIDAIVYDATVTNSHLSSNTINASVYAINVQGPGNFIAENTVISGIVTIASGSVLPILSTMKPMRSGIDIGVSGSPYFNDLYLSGEIHGAQKIHLSGLPIQTAEPGVLYVGGIKIIGSVGGNALFIHNQGSFASTWNINHGANSIHFVIDTYDSSGNLFTPTNVKIIDYNNIQITTPTPMTGKAVVAFTGGISGVTFLPPASTSEYDFTQTSNSDTWMIYHGLMTRNYLIQVFDGSGSVYIPDQINTVDENTIEVKLSDAISGTAVVLASPNLAIPNPTQHVHNQLIASSLWSINHNFGNKNFVITVFSGDIVVNPQQINAVSSGQIDISFSSPVSGRAVIVFDNIDISGIPALSGSVYVHTQTTSGTIWTINHNQNSSVYSITTFDSSGSVYIPATIDTINANTIRVTNSSPRTGKAVIVFPVARFSTDQTQYVHIQGTAATTWNVYHGLDTNDYSIEVFDSAGELYWPNSIKTIDSNTIQIVNPSPATGKAIVLFKNANINGSPVINSTGQTIVQELMSVISGGVNYGATGTSIPFDNTSPLFNEGAQIFSGTIIPDFSDSFADITANIYVSASGTAENLISSLFINPGPTDPAIAASALFMPTTSGPVNLQIKHRYPCTSGIPLNIVVRAGTETGTNALLLNYAGTTATLGNLISSWLNIKETRNV